MVCPAAAAVAAVVDDEEVPADAPVEVDAARPRLQVPGVAVEEEDEPARPGLRKEQGVERRAGDRDAEFLERLVEDEAVVGRQRRGAEDQALLAEVERGRAAAV